ncbi:MAG: epoxyqueuosine reductase QueH [Deltaproteobacteria bacterium]|nr:epoxyqueuosine reductase QueH [Deltaproteobacteria bacterium]
MKIFMHVCCGPCAAYPVQVLRDEGYEVQGYFINPNIHPYREFKRRLGALRELSEIINFKVDYEREYGLRSYLRQVVFHEDDRCPLCYAMRLRPTVIKAMAAGADAFSTTLLYSRYQKHAIIKEQCEALAVEFGIPFHYRDFREGWQRGIDMAIEMDLYRQPYCGCIYSEQERYDKKERKRLRMRNRD